MTALPDRLILSGRDGVWRWKRVTWNSQLLVLSAHSYPSLSACRAEAERINATPYALEISGIDPERRGVE